MALASGAHVKIGSYEFLLDEGIDSGSSVGALYRPHYRHTYESLFVPKASISGGSLPKDNLRPNRLTWYWNDWSGGESNRTWIEGDPTVYNFSYGLNPRIRRQLTGRPNRTIYTVGPAVDANGDVRKRGRFAVSQGDLWTFQARDNVNYSADGATFTAVSQANIGLNALNSAYLITSATGNNDKVYYSAWRDDSSTYGKRVTFSMVAGSAGVNFQNEQTNKPAFAGMTIMGGFLYGWTGGKLWQFDITQASVGADATQYVKQVSPAIIEPTTALGQLGNVWWADCVTAESSVFCFFSTAGQSAVYEYRARGGFNQIWNAPNGFTVKSMAYNGGILYFAGHWMGGWGGVYAMPIFTRRVVPLGFVRRQTGLNLQMQEMCAGFGNTIVVCGALTGRVFIYDADMDSISMLDTLPTHSDNAGGIELNFPQVAATDALHFIAQPTGATNYHRISDTITYNGKRMVMVYRPGSTDTGSNDSGKADADISNTHVVQLVSYDDDEPSNRQTGTSVADYSATLTSGDWDFDLPFTNKTLMGFDVMFVPLTTGQSIMVEYRTDGSGWVTAGTITSSSSGGRAYIDLSGSPVSYFSLAMRITLTGQRTGGVNYQPPILLGICAEAQLISYDQTWELILRLKNPNNNAGKRTASTSDYAWKARDYILNIVENKQAITFIDGYRNPFPGMNLKTYTVTIEDPQDMISRHGEGDLHVLLRKVPE